MLPVRRNLVRTAIAVSMLAVLAPGAAWASPSSGGTWRQPIEAPGLAKLNAGGDAIVRSLSCASPGNCVAGGFYSDKLKRQRAFVITQSAGKWGQAMPLPGTTRGVSQVTTVSCATPGNCGADGFFTDGSGNSEPFVASERSGKWAKATDVPGLAALGSRESIGPLSCPAAGSCVAGGTFKPGRGHKGAFAVSEKAGRWGKAVRLSGAKLQFTNLVQIFDISCPSPGNCTLAGGDRWAGALQAIAISEHAGQWGQAVKIDVPAALNSLTIELDEISCASPGNCAAGGSYQQGCDNGGDSGCNQAFLVDETGGHWGQAEEVPGTAALDVGNVAFLSSVSCASPGNCTAGGDYAASSSQQAFVISETAGHWGQAMPVPHLATLNVGGQAGISSLSCASAGNCSAGGLYTGHKPGSGKAFVVNQVGGQWGNALQVPGTSGLGLAEVTSVSCTAPGRCSAVGNYFPHGQAQVFVDSEN
jgi:hypothetical protein